MLSGGLGQDLLVEGCWMTFCFPLGSVHSIRLIGHSFCFPLLVSGKCPAFEDTPVEDADAECPVFVVASVIVAVSVFVAVFVILL